MEAFFKFTGKIKNNIRQSQTFFEALKQDMSRFPPIPESSKAYVALLKGVKIPHVPNHGQTNVSQHD